MFGSLTYLIVKLSEDNFNIQTQFIFENNNKAINLYVGNQLAKTLWPFKNYVTQ